MAAQMAGTGQRREESQRGCSRRAVQLQAARDEAAKSLAELSELRNSWSH